MPDGFIPRREVQCREFFGGPPLQRPQAPEDSSAPSERTNDDDKTTKKNGGVPPGRRAPSATRELTQVGQAGHQRTLGTPASSTSPQTRYLHDARRRGHPTGLKCSMHRPPSHVRFPGNPSPSTGHNTAHRPFSCGHQPAQPSSNGCGTPFAWADRPQEGARPALTSGPILSPQEARVALPIRGRHELARYSRAPGKPNHQRPGP